MFLTVLSERGYRFWLFWSQIGYCVCILVLELDLFFGKSYFFIISLLIRPSTKALQNAFNIGLNKGINYKAGLKQGIDLRERSF